MSAPTSRPTVPGVQPATRTQVTVTPAAAVTRKAIRQPRRPRTLPSTPVRRACLAARCGALPKPRSASASPRPNGVLSASYAAAA
ncbi:MAG: hypothetical protein ACRDP7_23690, partial [Trebonia sp.]